MRPGSPAAGAAGPPAPPEVRVGEVGEVAEWLAADFAVRAGRAAGDGRPFAVAIPGGSVAARCFPRLAALGLGRSGTEFFFADERAVPPDHPDSNLAQARALWLKPAGVPEERVHRLRGEAPDLERAARDYAAELAAVAGDPPRLDWVLLGAGPDGHVASLFPGHPALDDPRPVFPVVDAPKPPARRLTLSLAVLTAARRVVVVAFGAAKAAAIGEALEEAGSALPLARLLRGAGDALVLLDREAAGRLRG